MVNYVAAARTGAAPAAITNMKLTAHPSSSRPLNKLAMPMLATILLWLDRSLSLTPSDSGTLAWPTCLSRPMACPAWQATFADHVDLLSAVVSPFYI
eukprot:6202748-Amphidinium_carterae.2